MGADPSLALVVGPVLYLLALALVAVLCRMALREGGELEVEVKERSLRLAVRPSHQKIREQRDDGGKQEISTPGKARNTADRVVG